MPEPSPADRKLVGWWSADVFFQGSPNDWVLGFHADGRGVLSYVPWGMVATQDGFWWSVADGRISARAATSVQWHLEGDGKDRTSPGAFALDAAPFSIGPERLWTDETVDVLRFAPEPECLRHVGDAFGRVDDGPGVDASTWALDLWPTG